MTEISTRDPDLERKFLMKIHEETLSRKSDDSKEPILLSITNIASSLELMTKGSDKQGLFSNIIDSLAKKGFVKRYATSAVAITPEGIKAARNTL